jgi:hypothetical protein
LSPSRGLHVWHIFYLRLLLHLLICGIRFYRILRDRNHIIIHCCHRRTNNRCCHYSVPHVGCWHSIARLLKVDWTLIVAKALGMNGTLLTLLTLSCHP